MNEPPLPQNQEPTQLQGVPCPVCGAPNVAGAPFCRHCGYSLRPRQTGLDVLFIVLFVIIGVPSLLMGGCFTIFGVSESLQPSEGAPVAAFIAIGLVGIAIFGALLYLAFFRRKK